MADESIPNSSDPNQPATLGAPAGEPALNPAMETRLSAEAARRRVENNELKSQIASLTARLETLSQPSAAPAPAEKKQLTPDEFAASISEINAKLREANERANKLEAQSAAREEAAKRKMLRANLTRSLAEAKVLDVENAVILLEARGARLTDDDRVVMDVKEDGGDEKTVMLTSEALRTHRILGDHFFPPIGVGGSGSSAPRGMPVGIDPDRAKTDFKYFEENEKKVLDALREQRSR